MADFSQAHSLLAHPLLAAMSDIARDAGAIAMRYFTTGAETSARVDYKNGGSPVSEADIAVDTLLRERLRPLAPEAAWLSEETADNPDRLSSAKLFIVDPIDGTRAFIKGDERWSISIALVENQRPILAILHLPAIGDTFAAAKGGGAFLHRAGTITQLTTSGREILAGSTVGGPLGFLDALTKNHLDLVREPRVPSLAYRMARVASGDVDASMASADSWDWDVAAADLIVNEAGGLFTGLDGQQPLYNRERPRHGILAAGPPVLQRQLLEAMRIALPQKPS
ncbi:MULTISPECIES: 3'(2'),5'-bisphosphate nucleotidase CysQ [unclassified Beijerinckia]|uniref:3'(2'),5'-bisphosphate nucleotidase CysQ n=1 Tax=unclassified Beijerinckia TaxID=2638183 RepID=UPI0008988C4C|nr:MULTISPECIES: 3'(2'),5'-bisphosphate nucleotidase CysQ [unclassified Beijerinckia]MDH7796696.1 myo-inositol-1(or 4)-monophosphatase [Beijerinckia sp. GAS462]SEC56119.1 myo-inositol-1(or 4)-monophosphatase [Beijerinckia sp. 28-YEA-48]